MRSKLYRHSLPANRIENRVGIVNSSVTRLAQADLCCAGPFARPQACFDTPTSDRARSSAGLERLASPRTAMHLGPRAHLAPNAGQVS